MARFGVSTKSSSQACANAEAEIGDAWNFDGIRQASRNMWEELLERVGVDVETEDKNVVELLYSSVSTLLNASTTLQHLMTLTK